jgi:hypothetical protein
MTDPERAKYQDACYQRNRAVTELTRLREALREAVANYMQSEGCGCGDDAAHREHAKQLARLLRVPAYRP